MGFGEVAKSEKSQLEELIPVLMYGRETMLWKEKEKSRIRVVQMDNLRGLIGIRRMDRVVVRSEEGSR